MSGTVHRTWWVWHGTEGDDRRIVVDEVQDPSVPDRRPGLPWACPGIRIDGLEELLRDPAVRSDPRSRLLTTGEICGRVVKARTALYQAGTSSYVQVLGNSEQLKHLVSDKATVFVSHVWTYPFVKLLEAIKVCTIHIAFVLFDSTTVTESLGRDT